MSVQPVPAYYDDIYGVYKSKGLITSNPTVFNSYSGSDITAEIILPNSAPLVLGELQTFSYSIHRENSPVRTLGNVNPRGWVRGPRSTAGSMIFTVFNTYIFYRLAAFQAALKNNLYPLADMLPPFDMIITFANEYGSFSKMKILGMNFIDEGGTMSIDDLIVEQTTTYMARGIQPLIGYTPPPTSVTLGHGTTGQLPPGTHPPGGGPGPTAIEFIPGGSGNIVAEF